jgi:hypothetical protein
LYIVLVMPQTVIWENENRVNDTQSKTKTGSKLRTKTCSVSTWGKHLKKLSNVLTSLATLKLTFNANSLTLGTIAFGFTFVTPACKSKQPMHRD